MYVNGFEKRAHFMQNTKIWQFQPIITWRHQEP